MMKKKKQRKKKEKTPIMLVSICQELTANPSFILNATLR